MTTTTLQSYRCDVSRRCGSSANCLIDFNQRLSVNAAASVGDILIIDKLVEGSVLVKSTFVVHLAAQRRRDVILSVLCETQYRFRTRIDVVKPILLTIMIAKLFSSN